MCKRISTEQKAKDVKYSVKARIKSLQQKDSTSLFNISSFDPDYIKTLPKFIKQHSEIVAEINDMSIEEKMKIEEYLNWQLNQLDFNILVKLGNFIKSKPAIFISPILGWIFGYFFFVCLKFPIIISLLLYLLIMYLLYFLYLLKLKERFWYNYFLRLIKLE